MMSWSPQESIEMFMMRILQTSDLVTRRKLWEAHHEWRSEEEQEVACVFSAFCWLAGWISWTEFQNGLLCSKNKFQIDCCDVVMICLGKGESVDRKGSAKAIRRSARRVASSSHCRRVVEHPWEGAGTFREVRWLLLCYSCLKVACSNKNGSWVKVWILAGEGCS